MTDDTQLHKDLIRLAHDVPETREHLLPLLRNVRVARGRLEENKRYVITKPYRSAFGPLKQGDIILITEWEAPGYDGETYFEYNGMSLRRPQEMLSELLDKGVLAPEMTSLKMPRPKRQKIVTNPPYGGGKEEVPALVFGPWGIHKAPGGGWSITFVPTGDGLAFNLKSQKAAKQLLMEAAKAIPDFFTFRDLRQVERYFNVLKPLVQRYR